ncbi:MAG: glycosyltransferase family 1 protein [Nibricoccus sp.]
MSETFPPEVNGVALTLSRLVNGLCLRGHRVVVVRPRQRGEAAEGPRVHNAASEFEQWLVPGCPIPFYNALRVGLPSGGMLKRRWRARRPDLVHIATEGPLGYSALSAARKLGIPVTSGFHTNFHQYGGHYGFRFVRRFALGYLRRFHNRTRCTLVPTEELRSRLSRLKFKNLAVLSRGVDARLFSPARRSEALRKSWGAAADDPVVINVGRMAPEKNLDLAVETFRAMRLINPRSKLVLVGDGPLRGPLQAKYPDFIYTGMLEGEALATHYASADVFLFPSLTETFGNVVTEALASGLVVAGFDYAAMRQHVTNAVNGWSVKVGDRSAFIQMGCDVLGIRGDWPKMRAAARTMAQTISWETIVAQFEMLLSRQAGVELPPQPRGGSVPPQ